MINGPGVKYLPFRLTCLTATFDSGVSNLSDLLIQFDQYDLLILSLLKLMEGTYFSPM